MKKLLTALFSGILLLTLAALPVRAAGETASGELVDKDGKAVGRVSLEQDATGNVKLTVSYSGLPAGIHGIHFHAVGKCEGPDFASAGGHFNPDSKKHGLTNPEGPHAGDLLNMGVPPSRAGSFETSTNRVTLSAGPRSLLNSAGTALVIHANADDSATDPSGNSGARIACAVLKAGPANAAAPAGQGGAPSAPAAGFGFKAEEMPWLVWAVAGLAVLWGVSLAGLAKFRRR